MATPQGESGEQGPLEYGSYTLEEDSPSESLTSSPEELSLEQLNDTEANLHVIVAGLPKSGMSTGLNNIFDLKLPSRPSPRSVTTTVVPVTTTKHGISLKVIDIPGLAAPNSVRDDVTMRDLKEFGSKKAFLLILTLPVGPSCCITEGYCNTLRNLTTIFGPEIWDWCLVLLTFSDKICKNKFSSSGDKQRYVDHLGAHCQELQKVLKRIDIKNKVKLFLEYASFDNFTAETQGGIIAIPVGKVPEFPTKKLFPLQPWTHEYRWTDLAFMTVSKMNKNIPQADLLREALIKFRYGCFTMKDKIGAIAKAAVGGAVGGGAVGGAAGAGIGGGVGTIAVPGVGTVLGALVGGAVGTLAGGITGAVGIASGATAIFMIDKKLKLQRERKT